MSMIDDTFDAPADEAEAMRRRESAQKVLLHMPVDVRSVSLAILALLASLAAMQWAREVLVPILLGVMLSYALTPIVARLNRYGVPRAAAATLLLSAILMTIAWGIWALSAQTDDLLDTLPAVTAKFRQLSQNNGSPSTFNRVETAATELAAAANAGPDLSASAGSATLNSASAPVNAASGAGRAPSKARANLSSAPASKPETNVSKIDLKGYMLSGTLGALALLGQTAVVFFLALFLLASGNSFRRKMVKLAGPRLSQKKVTIETLDEIADQIQRYLLVQIGVSVLVGLATWGVFFAIGMEQSAVWGVAAGLTNLIPYVGAIAVSVGAALVAFVQFGTVQSALLVGGSSFLLHTLIGNLLTPWWLGRTSRMSAVAVFISVLLFGWLWGISGLLLGVPILMVVKSVCDRVEDLKPVGELLGT